MRPSPTGDPSTRRRTCKQQSLVGSRPNTQVTMTKSNPIDEWAVSADRRRDTAHTDAPTAGLLPTAERTAHMTSGRSPEGPRC